MNRCASNDYSSTFYNWQWVFDIAQEDFLQNCLNLGLRSSLHTSLCQLLKCFLDSTRPFVANWSKTKWLTIFFILFIRFSHGARLVWTSFPLKMESCFPWVMYCTVQKSKATIGLALLMVNWLFFLNSGQRHLNCTVCVYFVWWYESIRCDKYVWRLLIKMFFTALYVNKVKKVIEYCLRFLDISLL